MARRSLKPQLNQIRTWVQQGRTDAWIAHQLEVTVQQITTFKQENDLAAGDAPAAASDDLDLRAEDDALIAAELEKEEAIRAEEEAAKAAEEAAAAAARAEAGEDEPSDEDGDDEPKRPRRRGRRGGRGRSRRSNGSGPLEGTFDHGEEGYGLWLDPAVADDPVYAEYWAGNRDVVVSVEADQIVIRRAGEAAAE